MDSLMNYFLLIFLAYATVELSMGGAVYKVGDGNGWTSDGNVSYEMFSSSKKFHPGDTIIFLYDNQQHNVLQVSQEDYLSCNASSPMASYGSGNDSIVMGRKGSHFFICGIPGHCQAGQRVSIDVVPGETSPGQVTSDQVHAVCKENCAPPPGNPAQSYEPGQGPGAESGQGDGSGMSKGMAAGIVAAGLVGCIIISYVIDYLLSSSWKKKSKPQPEAPEAESP